MNPDFNTSINLAELLASVPVEIDRKVLEKIVPDHVGRAQAVSRRNLLLSLGPAMAALGMPAGRMDRNLRLSISRLRKQGVPICSTGGVNGGYFLASGQEELDEYLKIEVRARARDLLAQARAMYAGGRRLWGSPPGAAPS